MKSILSTKILTQSQKQRLLNASIGFVEYDAITIAPLDFVLPKEKVGYFIFTSQNGVAAALEKNIPITSSFCVGESTKKMLEKAGFPVIGHANNAATLAQYITKNHAGETYLYFSGSQRREDLPGILQKNNVRYKELTVYKRILNPKRFEQQFDGLLFFSPSGVKSFCGNNHIGDSEVFCIGGTTAAEANKYTDKISIAKTPTVDNVVVQVVLHFGKNKVNIK